MSAVAAGSGMTGSRTALRLERDTAQSLGVEEDGRADTMDWLRVGPRADASEEEAKDYERSIEISQNTSCVTHMDEFMYCMVSGVEGAEKRRGELRGRKENKEMGAMS